MQLKKRTKDNTNKKVLIYGHDGTGKSTFAEEYCKKNNLKPICIDIDDTNFTDVDIVEVDLSSDIKTFRSIRKVIEEAKASEEYDTIIVDGVSSLLELLVSDAKGLKKYSDRAERFNRILRDLQSSNKHLIFIGQADMKVIINEEHQSPKAIIKVNSFVNEKYHCLIDKTGKFTHEVEKMREVKGKSKPAMRSTLAGTDKRNIMKA